MFVDEEVYLEHYGKKGMHWGVRGTRRVQKRLDRLDRISKGTATTGDRFATGLLTNKRSADKMLKRGAKLQDKINHGQRKTQDILIKANGIKIKDLNYHQS